MSLPQVKAVLRNPVFKYFNKDPASNKKNAYVEEFLDTADDFCHYIANRANIKAMVVLGKAYSANLDEKSMDADGNDTRDVGGHAYPVYQFLSPKTNELEQYVLGEGTAFVVNRMNGANEEQCRSAMYQQNAFCLMAADLHRQQVERQKVERKQVALAASKVSKQKHLEDKASLAYNKHSVGEKKAGGGPEAHMAFNGIMLQTEMGHSNNFYGDALISSNALLYNQHHDAATGKPLKNCVYGSMWFTKNATSGKLSFGAPPEDPFNNIKGTTVFADIQGNLVDTIMAQKQPSRTSSTTTVSFETLQHQMASAVRELAGRKVPEAHWEAWMDRMYAKGQEGMFAIAPDNHVPFDKPGEFWVCLGENVLLCVLNGRTDSTFFMQYIQEGW